MIASLNRATPVLPPERTGTESLFNRLDSDGNGRLTVADEASVVVSLSPQGIARLADAANQGTDAGPQRGEAGGDDLGQRQDAESGPVAAQPRRAPDAPVKAGRPPGGTGQGQPASSGGSKTLQAADANQDGKVTAKEQQAYDARQATRWVALRSGALMSRGSEATAARYGAVQAMAA